MNGESERLLERARRAIEHGNLDAAIDSLRGALALDPDEPDAHAWLSLCLIGKRRLYGASEESKIALVMAPESVLARWVGAQVAIAERNFQRAKDLNDELVADDPTSALLHQQRAQIFALLHEFDEQQHALHDALRFDPDNAETLAALAEFELAHGSPKEAYRFAESALQISPENHSALVAMGTVLLKQGDVAGAREHCFLALSADATDVGALYLLTAIKTRENRILGLWWRYNSWMHRVGETRAIVILLSAFVIYRIASITADDLGATFLSAGVTVFWLAIVVYTWVGPALFRRALKKEIESIQLRSF